MGKLASLHRERIVAELYMEGRSVPEMAQLMGIAQSQVKNLMWTLSSRWRANADHNYADRVGQELARLMNVEETARREYRRSRKPGMIKRQEMVLRKAEQPPADIFDDGGQQPEPPEEQLVVVKETLETRGRLGDPRYLQIAKDCAIERLKLMGAYDDDSRVSFSPAQVFAMIDATVRAVELEGVAPELVQRIKARTLTMLPRPGNSGGVDQGHSPVVVEDTVAPHAHDASAATPNAAEPPDRPETIDAGAYDEEGGWQDGEEI